MNDNIYLIQSDIPVAIQRRWTALVLMAIFVLESITPGVILFAQAAQGASSQGTQQNVRINTQLPASVAVSTKQVLGTSPSDQEIAAFSLFEEPLVPSSQNGGQGENIALAQAINLYMQIGEMEKIEPLESFLKSHPDSRWAGSLYLNLGLIEYRTGYFSKCLETFEKSWALLKNEKGQDIERKAGRAVGELIRMNSRVGRKDVVAALLKEINGREFQGQGASKIQDGYSAVELMEKNPGTSFKCGPFALLSILNVQTPRHGKGKIIDEYQSSNKGVNLLELQKLAKSLGMHTQIAKRSPGSSIIIPCVVNWKVGHYGALIRKDSKGYVMKDPTFRDVLGIGTAAIDAESSGYFLIPEGKLPGGWQSVSDMEAATIWGKGAVADYPDSPGGPGRGGPGGSGCGMATWTFYSDTIALNVYDTPAGYQPARGTPIYFTAEYNQRDKFIVPDAPISNLGSKWTHNWSAYVMDTPGSELSNIKLVMRGGLARTYPMTSVNAQGQTVFGPEPQSLTPLIRISANEYHRLLEDGSIEKYSWIVNSIPQRKVLLTDVIDRDGNTTHLSYDSSNRLVAITDALGRISVIEYEGNSSRVKLFRDPFGRQANFGYDDKQRLISITDVIGIQSKFTYRGLTDSINSLETPYGKTNFDFDDYTSENVANDVRWIEATYPDGEKERIEFHNKLAPSEFSTDWSVRPTGMFVWDKPFYIYRNTFYWDKKGMKEGYPDRKTATIYHWQHGLNVDIADFGDFGPFLEASKKPLEGWVWYNYHKGGDWDSNSPGNGERNGSFAGATGLPTKIGRVLDDGTTQLYTSYYNDQNQLTKTIDPVGREFSYIYDESGLNLLEVRMTRNGASEKISSYSYDVKRRVSGVRGMTDQSQENFVYNEFGQITQSIANGKAIKYTYDNSSGPGSGSYGQLIRIDYPEGGFVAYTYDQYTRIKTETKDDYVLTYDYDDFDRITQIAYMDGTTEQYFYTRLDLGRYKDREGRLHIFAYDTSQNVISYTDPKNQKYTFSYCGCGSLEGFTDPMGNNTTWIYDLQGRLVRKIYPDGKTDAWSYEKSISRISMAGDSKKQANTNGQIKRYSYYKDNSLKKISYDHTITPTHEVSYVYDQNYLRISEVNDAFGVTKMQYYPMGDSNGAGQIHTIDGPFEDDTLVYNYDRKYRLKNLIMQGVSHQFEYDEQGRLNMFSGPAGKFKVDWFSNLDIPSLIRYPNKQSMEFEYTPLEYGHRLAGLRSVNPQGETLAAHQYSYHRYLLAVWKQMRLGHADRTLQMKYDAIGQLTAVQSASGSAQPIFENYKYDSGRNMVYQNTPSQHIEKSYNNLNQLVNGQSASTILVNGKVSKPAQVSINESEEILTDPEDNSFQAEIQPTLGVNQFGVTATDLSGNTTSKAFQFSQSSTVASQYQYDANGNLIDDPTRIYKWDGANRLVEIQYKGTDQLTRIQYNGFGRMTRIEEWQGEMKVGSKRIIWAGDVRMEIVDEITGERNFNCFLGHVTAGGDKAGIYYYNLDHIGSVREITDQSGAVIATFDYTSYGVPSRISGEINPIYSYTGHYLHEKSGLLFAPERSYDPAVGRWLSRDPIGENGGINLYNYCLNSPYNLLDKTGAIAETFPPSGIPDIGGLLRGGAQVIRGAGSLIGRGIQGGIELGSRAIPAVNLVAAGIVTTAVILTTQEPVADATLNAMPRRRRNPNIIPFPIPPNVTPIPTQRPVPPGSHPTEVPEREVPRREVPRPTPRPRPPVDPRRLPPQDPQDWEWIYPRPRICPRVLPEPAPSPQNPEPPVQEPIPLNPPEVAPNPLPFPFPVPIPVPVPVPDDEEEEPCEFIPINQELSECTNSNVPYLPDGRGKIPVTLCIAILRKPKLPLPSCGDRATISIYDEQWRMIDSRTVNSSSLSTSTELMVSPDRKYKVYVEASSSQGPVPVKVRIFAGQGEKIVGGTKTSRPNVPDSEFYMIEKALLLGSNKDETSIVPDCAECPEVTVEGGADE